MQCARHSPAPDLLPPVSVFAGAIVLRARWWISRRGGDETARRYNSSASAKRRHGKKGAAKQAFAAGRGRCDHGQPRLKRTTLRGACGAILHPRVGEMRTTTAVLALIMMIPASPQKPSPEDHTHNTRPKAFARQSLI
jgi:hypothetical protein